jgi:glutamine synthetase
MQAEKDEHAKPVEILPEDTLWVRFTFVDHAGIPKTKAVYRKDFQTRAEAGVGLAKGVMALDPSGHLHAASGLSPVGEVRLVPDLSSLTQLPFAVGQAMVLCDMSEPDGRTPWEGCPRSALKRTLDRLAEHGFESLASFETEFYLVGPEGPSDKTPYASSFALTPACEFAATLARTLEEMGISPKQYHAEVGHGQQELSIAEAEPLATADRRVLVLEAIRGVAYQLNLEAIAAPKPFLDGAGNGHHLHLSIYSQEEGGPVLFDPSGALSELGSAFVAGILEHLPAIMAFTTPSPNSYQRIAPGMWSSAYVSYGPDNREAAVRLASPMAGSERETANIELKPVDATANPYLALAAVLAAGMNGMERNLKPGEPALVDPATMSEEERASQGIYPLPTSLAQALNALEKDEVLKEALGEPLVRTHLAVGRGQVEGARMFSAEAVAAVARELY